jgi:hypothetical protein
MAIISLVYAVKQRKVIKNLLTKKGVEKDNYKRNEKYLLMKKVTK